MDFPENYFEDEVRCGFYVPNMMKRCWASAIEVLSDIAAVCEKHDIEWFAGWGTLLGTVRHEGFIPWDDDLDILMKRKDYEKFLRVAPDELPANYSLLNFHNDPGYDQFLTRVISGRSIDLNHDTLVKYHGFPYIAGVDIFPLDYISRNSEQDAIQQILIGAGVGAFKAVNDPDTPIEDKEAYIEAFEELTKTKIRRDGTEAEQLFDHSDKLMHIYDEKDADHIVLMPLWNTWGTHRFPKECFEKAVWLPYEGVGIKVPVGYREVLKSLYGTWWEYARSWAAHGYPYYNDMALQVRDTFGYGATRFKPSRELYDTLVKLRPALKKQLVSLKLSVGGHTSTLPESGSVSGTSETGTVCQSTVILLLWKGYMWESMAGIYRAAVEAGHNVVVIPVPCADKDIDGNPGDYYVDTEGIPDDIPVADPYSVDIVSLLPDIVFIQYPYDEFNDGSVADERFFARNLFKITPYLVYVPAFDMDEIYADDARGREFFPDFGLVSGVLYSDRVYVQSDIMRDLYIMEWTKMLGEDTGSDWEDRIRCAGNIREDMTSQDPYDLYEIPDEWISKLYRPDGSRRDVIMYNPLAGRSRTNGDKLLDKIEDDLDVFDRICDDTVLIMCPDISLISYFDEVCPDKRNRFYELLDRFAGSPYGILDDSGDMVRAVMLARAYIGDAGSLVPIFRRAKRPVMIRTEDMLYGRAGDVPEAHIYPGRGTVLGDKYYFTSFIYSGLYCLDLESAETKYVCNLPETNTYRKNAYGEMFEYDGRICITPFFAKDLVLFDPVTGGLETIAFWNDEERREDYYISCGTLTGGYVFLFRYYSDTVFRINITTHEIDRIEGWSGELEYSYAPYGCVTDGKYVYASDLMEDVFIKIGIEDLSVEIMHLPNSDSRYFGMYMDEDRLWLAPYLHGNMVCVKPSKDETPVSVDMSRVYTRGYRLDLRDMLRLDNRILMFSVDEPCFIAVNRSTLEVKKEYLGLSKSYLAYRDPGLEGPIENNAVKIGDTIYVSLYQRSELLIYDCIKGTKRILKMSVPESLRDNCADRVLEYTTAQTINRPAYVEQRYFGVPEFIRNMRDISEEIREESVEHHVGRDILNDVLS